MPARRRWAVRFLAFWLALVLTACAAKHESQPAKSDPPSSITPGGPAPDQTLAPIAYPALQISSKLSSDEASAVRDALAELRKHKFVGQSTAFAKVFGSDSMDGVERYLAERIHYIVSPAAANLKDAGKPSLHTLAGNLSIIYWLAREFTAASGWPVSIEGLSVDPRSLRVGLVEVGEDFPKLIPMRALSALVHEARHSDCTGGIDRGLVKKVDADAKTIDDALNMLQGQSCGHIHVPCPNGVLQGVTNCDARIWEAHTVEYVLERKFATACQDCSFGDKLKMQYAALDSASRILGLPEQMQKALAGWTIWAQGQPDTLAPIDAFAKFESALTTVDQFLDSAATGSPDLTSNGLIN